MKKNRVNKVCLVCGGEFEVIYSRRNTAKFCSSECSYQNKVGKDTWNKGKSHSLETKKKISNSVKGDKNPMYGKSHSIDSKKKMSLAKEGYIPYNKGKKFPGMFSDIDRSGENNAYVKYVMKSEGITYDEYLSRLSDKEQYARTVRLLTEQQPIHLLENYDKRGKAGVDGAYHLDHIYPISKGFENNIPPEKIASLSNLQFITWEENLEKTNRLYENSVLN